MENLEIQEQTRQLNDYTKIVIEHGISSSQAIKYKSNVKNKDMTALMNLTDFILRSARDVLNLDFKE